MALIDSYVKLLIHGDGTDSSTTIVDEIGKTISNDFNVDSYTKICSLFNGADAATSYSDPIAGAWTFNGNAQLDTAYKKYGSASLLLDGTGDYLSLADSANWSFGTGNWTIEMFIRFNALPADGERMAIINQHQDSNNCWHIFLHNVSNSYYLRIRQAYGGSDGSWGYGSGESLSTGVWYHICMSFDGTNIRTFISGVKKSEEAFGQNMGDHTGDLKLGYSEYAGSINLNGWIDNLRISKGICRYSTDFTEPSYEFGYTVLSTLQKRFGTSSLLINNGAYLYTPDNSDFNFGSNNFTIDTWIRPISFSGDNTYQVISAQASNTVDNNQGWYFFISASSIKFRYTTNGTWAGEVTLSRNYTFTTNYWYHIAAVRNGNNLYLFVGGILQGDSFDMTGVTIYNSTLNMTIGALADHTIGGWFMNSYIDELRITNGIARWSSDFTPPTRAYGSKRQKVIIA